MKTRSLFAKYLKIVDAENIDLRKEITCIKEILVEGSNTCSQTGKTIQVKRKIKSKDKKLHKQK